VAIGAFALVLHLGGRRLRLMVIEIEVTPAIGLGKPLGEGQERMRLLPHRERQEGRGLDPVLSVVG